MRQIRGASQPPLSTPHPLHPAFADLHVSLHGHDVPFQQPAPVSLLVTEEDALLITDEGALLVAT